MPTAIHMTGIGRRKRRFSTDENDNFYNEMTMNAMTIESISEDLKK